MHVQRIVISKKVRKRRKGGERRLFDERARGRTFIAVRESMREERKETKKERKCLSSFLFVPTVLSLVRALLEQQKR